MARYLRRLSLIACSFWIGCALQREYTMGQPLKCLCQNDLQKCPVENQCLRDRGAHQSMAKSSHSKCFQGYSAATPHTRRLKPQASARLRIMNTAISRWKHLAGDSCIVVTQATLLQAVKCSRDAMICPTCTSENDED